MIRATLLTEGSSDQVLLPILRWLLSSLTSTPLELVWADLGRLGARPGCLAEKVTCAVDLFPCDILFVHRDRDRDSVDHRAEEIRAACASGLIVVPVIPVQAQEAWLLIDERALRRASGKPTGRAGISLPNLREIENITDPKGRLHGALRAASGARGRRAHRFNPRVAAHRLAVLIDDWSPLEQLPAFQRLRRDTQATLTSIGVSDISSEDA